MTSKPDETTEDEPTVDPADQVDTAELEPAGSDEPKDAPPAEPLSVDDIPRTPSEAKQRVVATIKRAKAIGPAPVKQAVGGLVDRFFTSIDNFFDRWEGKK